ncbi:MAG TPA: EAL domain-containing protein [Polyangiaceae bacterium]|nr:EAL domain-containing protein [Polyangiaceae bacterium]
MVARATGKADDTPASGSTPGKERAPEGSDVSGAAWLARESTSGVLPVASSGEASGKGSVLLVDDDPTLLRSVERVLRKRGYEVSTACNGQEAVQQVIGGAFDVVLSDIAMPNMDGIQLLRAIREHDLHVPVVLITGEPTVGTAVQALEYGAFHYLTKPTASDDVLAIIDKAIRMHRMLRLKQQAAELLGHSGAIMVDRAGLEASFERTLQSLWMAYHPILRASDGGVFGYEALLRSNEPALPHPGAVLDAAERLNQMEALSRLIRRLASEPLVAAPGDEVLFVNLHTTDLLDPTLTSPNAPLSKIADRVVLEITERSSLDEVKDVRARVAALREMGFRIAVDDMGAGYAGLTSFALLEPEIVKLDMSLVRGVHESMTKQKVIRSLTSLSKDMGMMVVAAGVETVQEKAALVELVCDLLQCFLFARPGKPFPAVNWTSATA